MNDTKPSRKRRFLLFGCGGCLALLLALVAVPFAVGSQLEEEYHGHVVARFDRPPAEVFDALLDHRTTPVTGPQHEGTTDLPSEEGRAAWVEDMGESAITVRTIEQTEDARIVRTYEDSVVPMTARVELVLAPDGDGTRVTATSRMRVADGTWHVPVFRFILTVTGGANTSLEQYLGGIGTALGSAPSFD